MAISALTTLLLAGLILGPMVSPVHGATNGLNLVKSGLIASDSLTTGVISSYWHFDGSAAFQGAPYKYFEDSSGLHIGVQAQVTGTWAGYFAESPDTNGQLFHLVPTLSYTTIPDGSFNTGLYVQTYDPSSINYIGCVAVVTNSLTQSSYFWQVVQAQGPSLAAVVITTLYTSSINNQPLTQDCTIITNGSNYLKVYLGGKVVFESQSMTLNMPSPFDAYLEPQTSSSSAMRFGTYTNYYATTSEAVSVTGAPVGGTVKIVDPSNNMLASAAVDSNGNANLLVGMYRFPLNANIVAYDTTNQLVASTSAPVSIWGGDVYAVSAAQQSSITVQTVDTSNNAINGLYTTLSQNGAVINSGFTPKSFTVGNGQTYTVEVQDYSSYHFLYWQDTGSTNRDRTVTPGGSLTLTAVYCIGTCQKPTPPSGSSYISVTTTNSAGTAISGYYATLWQNGVQLQSCFSPCSFTVGNGQTYQVAVADHGGETFNHWSDGTTARFHPVTVPSSSTTISLTAVYNP